MTDLNFNFFYCKCDLFIGVVIDISEEVGEYGANINLEKRHLEEWAQHIGKIPKNSVLLVRFGWSKYWPNKKTYFGVDSTGTFHFPGKFLPHNFTRFLRFVLTNFYQFYYKVTFSANTKYLT